MSVPGWRIEPSLNGVTLTHLTCGQVLGVDGTEPISVDRLLGVIADHKCPRSPGA
jgi:hypothetical protein